MEEGKPDQNGLDFGHCRNVDGLDEVFEFLNLFAKFVDGDLLVLDDTHHLKLVDAVTDGNKFGGSPDEAFLLDGLDIFQHGVHVGLVIPWLHVQKNGGLGDEGRLLRLLLGVGLQTFLANLKGIEKATFTRFVYSCVYALPFVSDENLTEIIPNLEQLAWSSVYKEESLACHVTYPFNNKQGCFQDKINKIACQNYKYLS